MGEMVFDTREAAQAAANAAMPRRKHNRPYAQASGYHSTDLPVGRSRYIVVAYPNIIMLRDGSMFDHQRKVAVR